MIERIDSANVLFLDIETVSATASYEDLDENFQELWFHKTAGILRKPEDELTEEEADIAYRRRAAIYAEFGKVICIAVGVFTKEEDSRMGLRIKSFAGETEEETLAGFKKLIESKFDAKSLRMVAHNGKEFDFPYLCRRMLVNGIEIPETLDIRDKKPWDIIHVDTMEMWKFGDRKNFTSLDLLASLFGIESSKDDIDGSQVNEVFYKEKNLERIAKYCRRDVMVTAQVFLSLNGFKQIDKNNINYI